MNILIISQHFWPEQFRINQLAQALVKKGHNITVLTGLPNYPSGAIPKKYRAFWPKREKWNNISIIRIPLIPRGRASNIRLILNYLSFMLLSSVFAPFFCREDYDAILVFQTSPMTQALAGVVLSKLKKKPLYLWVQDLWPDSLSATKKVSNKFVIKWVGRFAGFIYRNCTVILTQSQAFHEPIQRYHKKANLIYYPNTCEEVYQPLSIMPFAIKQFNLPKGFIVMFAGNLGSAQALSTILEAAEKLRKHQDIQWVFIGEGSQNEHFQQQITQRKLSASIHCLGSYPLSQMPYLLSYAHICLATLNDNPIFSLTIPSKIQSYMACAKPILAAINGEAAQIIHKTRCGIAVPAENSSQLAQAVLELRSLPHQALEQLGYAGRRYFLDHYEHNRLLHHLENILRRGT